MYRNYRSTNIYLFRTETKALFEPLLSLKSYRNVIVSKIIYKWLIFSVRPVEALKYCNIFPLQAQLLL